VACRNPFWARDRARMLRELLQTTEDRLEKLRRRPVRKRNPLRGEKEIAVEVGKVLGPPR